MSAGQPLLDPTPHFQHAAHPHHASHHRFRSSIEANPDFQPDASGPGAAPSFFSSAMDPSQFGDFSFAYGNLSALTDQSASAFDDSSAAEHFALHSTLAPGQPTGADMSSLTVGPNATFSMDPSAFTNPASLDVHHSPDGAAHPERRSPPRPSNPDAQAHSHAPNDDFGLAAHGRADGTDLGKTKDDKTETPAWSELKTKAGKERKRLPLACIACRRKKIRCSGEKPACKHCLRSRIPCVYKVTSRKAAPRTDYMAMLDKRLKRMEERIIKAVPKTDHDAMPFVTRAVVKPAIPGTNARKRRADEAFVFSPELEAWAHAPSRSKIGSEESPVLVPESPEKDESKLFREGTDALPPKDIQEHLAEVFFDHVYGQAYHLLHKPSFMRKLK